MAKSLKSSLSSLSSNGDCTKTYWYSKRGLVGMGVSVPTRFMEFFAVTVCKDQSSQNIVKKDNNSLTCRCLCFSRFCKRSNSELIWSVAVSSRWIMLFTIGGRSPAAPGGVLGTDLCRLAWLLRMSARKSSIMAPLAAGRGGE